MGEEERRQLVVNNNVPVVQILAAAWLGLYIPSLFVIVPVGAMTTESPDNATNTTDDTSSGFNLLIYLPQSAVSLLSLAAFIGISVAGAWLAEKLYERLSLRDDSSDMSEHTKLILRQRILGMVFAKNLDLTKLTGKEKEKELIKKYAQLWQYKAAMKRKKRKDDTRKAQEQKRKSSVFGGIFGSNNDKASEKDDRGTKVISKRPSQPAIIEESTGKSKRQMVESDFVAIDIKTTEKPKNAKVTKLTTLPSNNKNGTNTANAFVNKNKDFTVNVTNDDEFDFAEIQDVSKKGENGVKRESSMNKYVRPPSSFQKAGGSNTKTPPPPPNKKEPNRPVSRPLTAGQSRPITAGATNRTSSDYKSQGNNVRKEVMKKLALFD